MRHPIAGFVVAAALVVTATVVPVGGASAHAAASGRAPMDPVVPIAVPAAPIVVESAGAGLGLSVAWLPDDPADAVTSFTITATPVAGTETAECPDPTAVTFDVTAPATGAVVPGLCAQVAYTATVVAQNDVGDSGPSNVSDPAAALEAQVPAMPLIGGTLGRDGSAPIAWVAPYYDGGAAVTSYSITVRDLSDVVVSDTSVDASVTSTTITGLTNDVVYEVSLTAVNAVGASGEATATLTPSAAYAPIAPSGLQAVPDGVGGIKLSWLAPGDDGGDAVTSYAISYQRAELVEGVWTPVDEAPNHTLTTGPANLAVTATVFEEATANYLFTVAAVNSIGSGASAVTQSAVSPNVGIRGTTKVLNEATVAELDLVNDWQLVWYPAVPAQVSGLAIGDVVVAGVSIVFPAGVLREITDIYEAGDGTITLDTVNASLDDVFSAMSMATAVDTAVSPPSTDSPQVRGSGSRFVPATSGVQMMPSAVEISPDFTLGEVLHYKWKAGVASAHAKLEASMEMTLGVSAELSVDMKFDGIADPSLAVKAAATVSATASLEASITGELEKEIGLIHLTPQVYMVGVVPVVVVPKVVVVLQVGGELAFKASATATAGGSLSWSSKDAGHLNVVKNPPKFKPIGDVDAGTSTTASAWIALKFDNVAALYDIAGPSVSATLKLKGTVDFHPDPGEPFFTLEPSVEIKAGVALELLGFYADAEASLTTVFLPKFKRFGVPAVTLSVSPGAPAVDVGSSEVFTATRSDGLTRPITWKVVGGVPGDAITTGGVFTPVAPGNRGVTIQAKDGDGNIGTAFAIVGERFDAPGSLALTYREDSHSLRATWAVPATAGGASIADYVITTDPYSGTHTTTETSFTIEGVEPGNYDVTVRARNTSERVSPPATATYLGPGCEARSDSGGTVFTGPDPADCAPEYASGYGSRSINGLSYTIDIANLAAGATCTGYHGAPHGPAVTIAPSVYIGGTSYPVTTIGEYAFDMDSLTSVSIPDSVTTIGKFAFSSSSLQSVTIPDSVTAIADFAFSNSSVTSATIGDVGTPGVNPVGTIGEYAFNGTPLTSVTIGNPITAIGAYAFSGSQVRSATFGSSVTTIAEQSFYGNQLTSVTIPDSVTTIGPYAFSSNQLTSATIGTSGAPVGEAVGVIGDQAFSSNQLTSLAIGNSVATIGNCAFCSNQLTSVDIPDSVTAIGDTAFVSNQIASVSIGDGVVTIGGSAFAGNRVTSATFGNSVRTIGDWAFAGNELATVTLPTSVATIGNGAFGGNLLASVIIPASVSAISANAFGWNVLTSVLFEGEAPTVGSDAFVNASGGFEPVISYYVRNAGSEFTSPTWTAGGTAYASQGLATVTFDDNGHGSPPSPVDVVAGSGLPDPGAPTAEGFGFDGWFAAASGGEALTFPLTVAADTTLFAHWTNLTVTTTVGGITYSADRSNVAAGATATDYDGTAQGTDVSIPASVTIDGTEYAVTTVGTGAFLGDLLTSVTLPASVTAIGGSAFQGNLLASVTIPGSVATLGAHAYSGNPNLAQAIFVGDVPGSVGAEPFGSAGDPAGPLVSYYAAHSASGFTTPTWDAGGVTYRSEERSAAVTQTFTAAPAPTVSGAATVGETLTAHTGTWAPAPDTFSYQWLRDGAPIAGASGDTYDLSAPDLGALIRVAVTATKVGLPTTTLTSAPTSAVAPAVPSVSTVSPSSGPVAGGTTVTITGSGLTGATGVTFDGVAGTALSVASDTSLTVTSPAHAAGPVNVVVTTPGGSSVAAMFSYATPPVVLTDIAGSPFVADIQWMADQGISTGYADGTFRPAANVSRQAMAAFMYRFAGSPAFTPPVTSPFNDVPTSSPFYTEICWMADQAISTGYADGGFHPTADVSRQAMAAFMYRFAGRPAFTPPVTSPFTDVPTDSPFYTEIAWMADTAISTGYADGGFHPAANVSRQAMAAFMHRLDGVLNP